VAALHERTGGNPFFVRQLVRLLREAPDQTDPSGRPIPPGVRHVIASRLRSLPDAVSALLGAAAVIGREFTLRPAAAAAGLTMMDALDALDVAARHGLVEPAVDTDLHRFVHALVQEVVLQDLPAGRAARLHAAVAEQLAQNGTATPAALAEHMWAAREIVGPAAAASQLAAADAARTVFAYEQAEVHLRRAIHLLRHAVPPDPDTELSALLALFSLIVIARGWGDRDACEVVDRAVELTGAGVLSDKSARVWWSLFFFLIDRNDQAGYVDVARSLLAACSKGAPGDGIGDATRGAVHLMNVFSALSTDDREGAQAHLLQARSHIAAAGVADLAAYDENLQVMQYLIEGYLHGMRGEAGAHRSAIEAAVALADADGRPFPRAVARTLGAATGPFGSDLEFFRTLSAEALELDHRFGFGWLATLAECIYDWSETLGGRADAGTIAALETRLDEMLAAGRHGTHSTMLLLLGDVQAVQGQVERARDTLIQARNGPGPYRGLFVDLIDRRLASLG
jgi:hypothetical protein